MAIAVAESAATIPDPPRRDSEDEEGSQDYHTEASDGSVSPSHEPMTTSAHQPEDDADPSPIKPGPYLPAHLLKAPLPSSPQVQPTPGKDLSRKQKKAQRRTNRQLKKRQWDQLRADAQANGVLEAGKAAQVKWGVLRESDRVRSGRVGKKRKVGREVSGREMMLEERKRERAGGQGGVPSKKKVKTKSSG
ncbi:hypothetical protein B0A54_13613 [Friedmanniomyces endolithicus]|uniref:Uncharacterized protein n=1 Tax=Friedmanniomyces endolithicus TaxID=329885 RepID=A0A4U0UG65_9PEZI|nr:hypothetical protein LTS09_010426 [Friedmanniomyces endolithicus]TKA34558.1 hypothetical protein B0A54_13613 [Friedmanniomyces endolithicus]